MWTISQEELAETAEDETSVALADRENYDYLLGMAMWNLTKEKKDALLQQRDDKQAELRRLQVRTPLSIWKEDLDTLMEELEKVWLMIGKSMLDELLKTWFWNNNFTTNINQEIYCVWTTQT